MKKLSVVLAIVLCFSACFCVPVSAASPEVDLYVTAIGTDLTVSIESGSDLGAIQGTIVYDKDVITYDSSAVNAAISSANTLSDTFSNSASAGSTSVALVGNSSSGTSGEWATIGYVAPVGTPADFSLSGFRAFSKTGAVTKAKFVVIMPGDANGDKLVNVKDYVKFKKILSQGDTLPDVVKNLDVNKSGGNYNSIDFSQLRSNLLLG